MSPVDTSNSKRNLYQNISLSMKVPVRKPIIIIYHFIIELRGNSLSNIFEIPL